jgi:hypothetical protein
MPAAEAQTARRAAIKVDLLNDLNFATPLTIEGVAASWPAAAEVPLAHPLYNDQQNALGLTTAD